ncbi:MAG TPA: hypothetical protein VGD05_00195 [Pyrinomonadaceae bacterium]|jgi:hypothetical protein
MKIVGKVATGDLPHEVILSARGRTAFVANYGAQTPGSPLSIIDLDAKKAYSLLSIKSLSYFFILSFYREFFLLKN